MGFFDSIKKAVSGGGKTETIKGPSTVLREAGVDTSGLDINIGGDGRVSVGGRVATQEECDRICELLEDIPQVTGVDNQMSVGAPEPEPVPEPIPEPEPEPAPVAEAPADPEPAADPAPSQPETEQAPDAESGEASEGRTYTVQPGDSLWKISAEQLGNGADYMKIFEANRDLLDDPNKIFPGQELKIPDTED